MPDSFIPESMLRERPDLKVIMEMVPSGARVLDLGCGNGALLKMLRERKNVHGSGVEVSQPKIIESVANGVPVIHRDLNQGLRDFRDHSFDYVILSQTLQAVKRPDKLIDEMLRVGRSAIISLINFGYFPIRLQLLLNGRMPVSPVLPEAWYATPNIHLCTIKDFKQLCQVKNIKVVRQVPLGHGLGTLATAAPNLFAPNCVFVISAPSTGKL